MKTKTYILTLSRTFPKGHPREGEETHFEERVRCGTYYGKRIGDNSRLLAKRHTIRANYDLWKQRVDEVNAGRAVLSVREWLGAPRRSRQRELFRLDRDSGIGVERLVLMELDQKKVIDNDPERWVWYWAGDVAGSMTAVMDFDIANNDGLTLEDWRAWFRGYDRTRPMAVIHFTKFRYCN